MCGASEEFKRGLVAGYVSAAEAIEENADKVANDPCQFAQELKQYAIKWGERQGVEYVVVVGDDDLEDELTPGAPEPALTM